MDEIQEGFAFSDKGLRAIIGAYEHALGYEEINTAKMKRKQLLAYFGAIRSKADLENNPDRQELFKLYLGARLLEDLSEQASYN